MSMTIVKKAVGSISFVAGWLAMFATTEHIAALQAFFVATGTTGKVSVMIISTLVLLGNLWGKHLGSSPSVADAVKEGTISQEVARVNASS